MLQPDHNNVLKWLDENRLFLNANKLNVMVFSTPQRQKIESVITINNSVLQQVDNIKLLGIYIDASLYWKYHNDNLLKKTNFKSSYNMQIVKDFTISSLKYCLLNYISTVFGLLFNSVGLKPNDNY